MEMHGDMAMTKSDSFEGVSEAQIVSGLRFEHAFWPGI
jgi:hypothetical protein